MNFNDVSKVMSAHKFLDNVKEKTLLIYSLTSVEKNDIKLNNKNITYISTNTITKRVDIIDKNIESFDKFEQVITIGGGTATDIGKYIAHKLNLKLICIISLLSTNAYATDKVAMIVDNVKITLLAKMPDIIIIDESIIKKSTKYNLYGLADVFSIYTAIKDWDISIEDKIDDMNDIYYDSIRLLNRTIKFVKENTYEQICNNSKELFYLIGEAGYITNKYGSGKPESGSEHIFAKELESIIEIPHAIAVSNGIILMSLLQNNYSKDIFDCLNKLKLFKESVELGINFQLLKRAFNNIKPRKDRYTIVDRINKDINYKNEKFLEFKKIMGDYYANN